MARSIKKIEGDETVHYVSPRAKRGRAKAKIGVPMTAMIDVTFQLLIYFILTTTFRQTEGQIPGTLPSAGASGASTPEQLQSPIKILLHPTGIANDGVFYEIVGQNPRIESARELRDALAGCKQRGGVESPVIINARRDVRWKYVVEVFNQVVANEFKNIAFQNTT
ncbi:MAG: biopolymer transporter ExbD [Phycisphaerae bacterium]|jgi:biopolymer transport protein ExbD|nr:biopolymer transporter ExbD [Phycisphaerae bacterium]